MPTRFRQRFLLGGTLLALFLLFIPLTPAHAGPGDPAAMDQAEVERQLSLLQKGIAELRIQLEASRAELRSEEKQLRTLDLAIQETSRQMRELDGQKAKHLAELEVLDARREEQLQALHSRQDQLGKQIAATYRLSGQSRVKLILNQDNPAQLNRMLAYYNHINRAQLEKINAIKAMLGQLEETFRAIDEELSRLEAVQNSQREVLQKQQQQRVDRTAVLATLASRVDSEQAQLAEYERNRKELEILLEKLSDVLADIPADLGRHLGVASQKGALPMPVRSRVLHAFGQYRAANMKWQGWLLEAGTGTEVRNIAYGRVAFADWLRGYGLLIIIDHGQGFMSLYGYNESLLWEVGDWVEPGAVIATIGDNPGGEQGLYFELRKDGKAVDPAAWLKR